MRVRVHLAGLEAQELWSKLEPKISDVEAIARDKSTQALDAIIGLTKKLEKLVASIGKPS